MPGLRLIRGTFLRLLVAVAMLGSAPTQATVPSGMVFRHLAAQEELKKDLLARLKFIGKKISEIEKRGALRVPEAKERLARRLAELLDDRSALDDKRLELELALYADRLDMTEESVRFRSHVTFFRKAIDEEETPGRKLNFLVQEMNREVNTMGSKANDAVIAQTVVGVKEELEKIREQLQNIE